MAEQMGALVSLYTAEEVKDHLCPIAQFLVRDKVAAVRTSAVEAYTIIIQHLLAQSGGELCSAHSFSIRTQAYSLYTEYFSAHETNSSWTKL